MLRLYHSLAKSYSDLQEAAKKGNVVEVRRLLQDPSILSVAVLNSRKKMEMFDAARNGHVEVMRALLEHSIYQVAVARIHHDGESVLYTAIDHGQLLMVDFLLELPSVRGILYENHQTLQYIVRKLETSTGNIEYFTAYSTMLFRVLQCYQRDRIPFPTDISVPQATPETSRTLTDFFNSAACSQVGGYELLQSKLRSSTILSTINEYLQPAYIPLGTLTAFLVPSATAMPPLTFNLKTVPGYTQDALFEKIILPLFGDYPEITWFADREVAVTEEGTGTHSEHHWTQRLVQCGRLPITTQAYVELERTLQSVICSHLLYEGTEAAYRYWVQAQTTERLTFKSFRMLHERMTRYVNSEAKIKMIEASLVYSDLGKTPEAKRRAHAQGIKHSDHDDFMDAVYSAMAEIRDKIIPSFSKLDARIQADILELHRSIQLHWGHVFHIEGGEAMFNRLSVSKKKQDSEKVHQAFLIQVCDVAASAAQFNPKGSVTFNETSYMGHELVLSVIQEICTNDLKPNTALDMLYRYRQEKLGYTDCTVLSTEKIMLLTRLGAFLRFYTVDSGEKLLAAAVKLWSSEDWSFMSAIFGLNSGINRWKRNPTYMTTVLLNLFASTKDPELKYESAIRGAMCLAQVCAKYESLGKHTSDTPLCFNPLAGQCKDPESFFREFNIDHIIWAPEGPVLSRAKRALIHQT